MVLKVKPSKSHIKTDFFTFTFLVVTLKKKSVLDSCCGIIPKKWRLNSKSYLSHRNIALAALLETHIPFRFILCILTHFNIYF